MPNKSFTVIGLSVSANPLAEVVDSIIASAVEKRSLEVHLCNSYTLSLAKGSSELYETLRTADLNLPDGAPVAWLGRKAGARGPIRGPDLVSAVMNEGRSHGLRHYLWGGAQGIAARMKELAEAEWAGVEIVGADAPPFAPVDQIDLEAVAQSLRRTGANICWVGLGTPKQDIATKRLAQLVNIPIVPVGAAFDFAAGSVREAPRWLRGTGLEWVYRLVREPRRLWRRYLINSPRLYFWHVADAIRRLFGR